MRTEEQKAKMSDKLTVELSVTPKAVLMVNSLV